MSDFINLVLCAFDPTSPTNQEAQKTIISMKNSNCNNFLETICKSIQIPSLDEKTIQLLLILSREAFSRDIESATSDQQNISSETLSKYESILIMAMNDPRQKVRYHSSMCLGHFGFYCILRDPLFLVHFFQIFDMNNSTNEFTISYEKSLLYILKQTCFSTEQKKQISLFIITRLSIDSSLTEEKSICLQMLLLISPSFLTFFTQEENVNIFQLLKNFSMNIELTYYSFSIWSKIIKKNPSLISCELFHDLMEISILIVSNIESESDIQPVNGEFFLDNKARSKFEIFKLWIFSIGSDCPLTATISPYLPKLAEFGLKNLFIPCLDEDSFNIATDHASFLLSSIIVTFPNESIPLFLPFIESKFDQQQDQTDPSVMKDQYDAFVLFMLILQTDLAESFLTHSIQLIQTALSSPIRQIQIVGLNIISRITDFYDVEPILSQIDFTSFLPLCMNFFRTGIFYVQSESISTIKKIVLMVNSIDFNEPNINSNLLKYKEFKKMELIKEILSLIQPNSSSEQIKACLSLVEDLVVYVDDFNSLLFIFQFTCQFISIIVEGNPNDSCISSSCMLITTILSNNQKFTFPIDLLTQLFQLLIGLQTTENGDQAIFTIGFIARAMKDSFQPFLSTTIATSLHNIDHKTFVLHSILCLQMVMRALNLSPALPEIVARLFSVLNDENSSGNEYVVTFQTFKNIFRLYYDFLETNPDLLNCMINFINSAVESLNDMIENDKETALTIAYLLFDLYSILFENDLKKKFGFISSHFFILTSTIITANRRKDDDADDDELESEVKIPSEFVGQLIVTVKLLADTFGPSLHTVLDKSHILEFLAGIANLYQQGQAKDSIDHIMSIVCNQQQQ